MELICVDVGTEVSVEIKKKRKKRRGNMWNHVGANDTRNEKKTRKQVWTLGSVCCLCHVTFIPTF